MTGPGLFQGCIDVIQEDIVSGWLFSPFGACLPLLFVDTVPATLIGDHLPRPDVGEVLGVSDDTGFAFRLPRTGRDSVLSLFCVSQRGIFFIEQKKFGVPVCERSFVAQVSRARDIASKDGAVAVVCWEGAHNPIGRAKVLYDIAARHHPVVLFAYLHAEFGGRLWLPLVNDDSAFVTIPWEERSLYHQYILRSHLAFDTVWICKPRFPSFSLASLVAKPNARIIVDIDDDEESFIEAQTARTAYNKPGVNISRELLQAVAARTVASVTLQQRYGGTLIRHARTCQHFPRSGERTVKKIGFIGTVRHHKHIVALAKAIRLIQFTHGISLEFHVYGDIQPPEELELLKANGAVVKSFVPMGEHMRDVASLDAVVTGFPTEDLLGQAITNVQVPAKIFDALAVGVPVITPDTPAIADIRDVNGVYPFTLSTFTTQIVRALNHTKPITLPADATLDGASKGFAKALEMAQPVPELHALLPNPVSSPHATKTLLLLWKQHDAGLYGRRVDQIARSSRRLFPEMRVIILELLPELPDMVLSFEDIATDCSDEYEGELFTDEQARKSAFLLLKQHGYERDGIFYRTLVYGKEKDLPRQLFRFLVQEDCLPDTTTLVLFPILQEYRFIEDILRSYRTIVDVVDNQMSWASDEQRGVFVLEQYFRLFTNARTVVFNCEPAKQFFADRQYLTTTKAVHVIPNWYTLPPCPQKEYRPLGGHCHVWYSGNMNDRIDWDLLHTVADSAGVRLHLAGTAQRVPEKLDALLKKERVIYHGVTTEQETLDLLASMHCALVPHILDGVSRFMDPIKLAMYQAVGIPVICPSGLTAASDGLYLYGNASEAVRGITECAAVKERRTYRRAPKAEAMYCELLR